MLVWLLQEFAPLLEQLDFGGSFGTGSGPRPLITARTALASLTSFVMALMLGPRCIAWLKRRFTERIDSASATLNALHASKDRTPTMGGLFIVASTLLSTLLWGNLTSPLLQIGLGLCCAYGLIGAADDWVKLQGRRRGLSVREKLTAQTAVAFLISQLLYEQLLDIPDGTALHVPIIKSQIALGWGLVPWSTLVLVATANAVNLTDGLDGLASGCGLFSGAALLALTYLSGHAVLAGYLRIPAVAGSGEFCILLGAMIGAVLGFLWFNCFPADVFMGDTGSLPIGGTLALAALIARQELLLILIGGVFVVEAASVLGQVTSFRLTGRRIFACSPLHNHFLFRGHHEIKITVRFWIASALCSILALTLLKLG